MSGWRDGTVGAPAAPEGGAATVEAGNGVEVACFGSAGSSLVVDGRWAPSAQGRSAVPLAGREAPLGGAAFVSVPMGAA